MRVAGLLLLLLLAALPACGRRAPSPQNETPSFSPTGDLLLSTNSPTKDEDPSVLRARDGALFVAWFSDRGGNPDIYLTRTLRGTEWEPAIRLTTSVDGDFYPNLIQDDQGIFHVVWFRWNAFFRGHIMHNSSADGLTWDPRTETQVTTALDVDDWVPTIAQAADGTLLVCFVSIRRNPANPTNEIYLTSRRPATSTWSQPAPVTVLNSATEHDHLPFVARVGANMALVWVRTDVTQPAPWQSTDADLLFSTSGDGVTWSRPLRITNDAAPVVHVFPALYANLDQESSIVWLSTRLGPPRVFELPTALADLYPQAAAENTMVATGYSHRIAATPTSRVHLGVWVQGPEGAQDIYYRFFRR